jgi:nicotinate-nucleotide adenylyltransferase
MQPVLGVFGGTFDPIHCGHLELARELLETLALSAIRFVPAGDPPHRSAPAAPAADRLAMVELAVANHPGLEADAREIERTGKSYTVTTLEELRGEDRKRALALIVGADAFLGLPTWHRWREIFELAHLVVVARPGVAIDDRMSPELAREWTRRRCGDAAVLSVKIAGAIIEPRVTAHPISASAIREALSRRGNRTNATGSGSDAAGSMSDAAGRGPGTLRGLLPAAVLAYIERNRLYLPPQDAT